MARFFLRQRLTSYCGMRRVQQSNRSQVLAKIPYSCNTLWRHVSAVMSFISSQRSAFGRNLVSMNPLQRRIFHYSRKPHTHHSPDLLIFTMLIQQPLIKILQLSVNLNNINQNSLKYFQP